MQLDRFLPHIARNSLTRKKTSKSVHTFITNTDIDKLIILLLSRKTLLKINAKFGRILLHPVKTIKIKYRVRIQFEIT